MDRLHPDLRRRGGDPDLNGRQVRFGVRDGVGPDPLCRPDRYLPGAFGTQHPEVPVLAEDPDPEPAGCRNGPMDDFGGLFVPGSVVPVHVEDPDHTSAGNQGREEDHREPGKAIKKRPHPYSPPCVRRGRRGRVR
jgi:hypothetical protein